MARAMARNSYGFHECLSKWPELLYVWSTSGLVSVGHFENITEIHMIRLGHGPGHWAMARAMALNSYGFHECFSKWPELLYVWFKKWPTQTHDEIRVHV